MDAVVSKWCIKGPSLSLLWRVVLTIAITLAVIFVGIEWIAPIALSFYAARTAPQVARVVPTELQDHSISHAPGQKLSYFGYEFEVPWNDLDENQTKLYPKNKPQFRADVHFHSGLRVIVSAVPAGDWIDELANDLNVPKQRIASNFGDSDYDVERTILEFTPDSMNHWSLSPRVHAHEAFLLVLKSLIPLKPANSGIFNIHNPAFKGFQEGTPKLEKDGIYIHLFDRDGSIEFIFVEKTTERGFSGVTQADVNRIIESLRRVPEPMSVVAQKVSD